MAKSRKNGNKVKHVHVDKHASKRPTHKDAWRKNDKSDSVVDVEATRALLRSFDRPSGKKSRQNDESAR